MTAIVSIFDLFHHPMWSTILSSLSLDSSGEMKIIISCWGLLLVKNKDMQAMQQPPYRIRKLGLSCWLHMNHATLYLLIYFLVKNLFIEHSNNIFSLFMFLFQNLIFVSATTILAHIHNTLLNNFLSYSTIDASSLFREIIMLNTIFLVWSQIHHNYR